MAKESTDLPALTAPESPEPNATETIVVNAEAHRQPFNGWGTSLAWFANRTGDWSVREELAALLFNPPHEGESLGFTIARYDIGGGDHPDHAGKLRVGADVPSWRPDPDQDYDEAADSRQRWWLNAAAERAGQEFIADAIAYSAPWWMTISGRSNGYLDGTADHLIPGYESTFAAYLTDVVHHLAQHDAISFRTLSPLNEPGTAYWKADTKQEGMRVSPGASQRRLLDATWDALRERGLPTGLSAVDETGVESSLTALDALTEAGLDWHRIDQINVHTYLDGDRRALHELATRTLGKRLQMSEVTIDGGAYAPQTIQPSLAWAAHLTTDLTQLQPSEYVYWQAIEAEIDTVEGNGNWGFIHDHTPRSETYTVTKKFHAMRQYTNFIRPGAIFLETSSDRVIAAVDAMRSAVTTVIYNESSAEQPVTFEFTGLTSGASQAQVFRTSADEDRADLGSLDVEQGSLAVRLAPLSITTFCLPTGHTE